MAGSKQAFAPLLAPGRHVMSLNTLSDLTVGQFPSSTRRRFLFSEMERLVLDLIRLGVVCELWVDGSFMTAKEEPDDIDLSFSIWWDDFDALPDAVQEALTNDLDGGKKYSPYLDTYVCPRFSREDPRRAADKTDYWAEKWGIGWDDRLKGYAVIKLGETNVGLKLVA